MTGCKRNRIISHGSNLKDELHCGDLEQQYGRSAFSEKKMLQCLTDTGEPTEGSNRPSLILCCIKCFAIYIMFMGLKKNRL